MYTRSMNIIATIRTNAGMTQQELADKANITRRYVISLEKSIPSTVPEAVLEVLSTLGGVAPDSIPNAYYYHRRDQIEYYTERIKDCIGDTDLSNMDMIDFRYHLEDITGLSMSQIKFAEYFGINPASLSVYERGGCRTMPTEIREVFLSLGFSEDQIGKLDVNTCI